MMKIMTRYLMNGFLRKGLLLFAASSLSVGCSGGHEDNGQNGGQTGNGGAGTEVPAPAQPSKTNKMNVYIHYMPWFVAPASTGVWNHWTMSANALAADESNIASHYHPLTGAYASDDEAILDYQCLLMKYSGADGVMIDWYGTQDKNDYPQNERHTRAMKKAIEKAGMKFAIVYEDATLNHAEDKAGQARQDMRSLRNDYMGSKSYVKIDDRPLLLVFGPQGLTSPKDWNYAFGVFTTSPVFVVLNGFSGKANDNQYQNAQGEFLWVNPNPQYSDADRHHIYIGGAMPGFWDVYKEHGQGNGYTTYDREEGALFDRQLNAARNARLDWLQVSTWNDYGEGTTIEPTHEYGYQYLVKLQQFTGVAYTQHHLELVYRWYRLRKAKPADKRVGQAYDWLNALQPEKAEEIIQTLES